MVSLTLGIFRKKFRNMLVSIHQPETYPQLSYFDKIKRSDLFIILDNVNYRKNYFQNRNVLNMESGEKVYLTLPVNKKTDLIFNKIVTDPLIAKKHFSTIKNIYGAAPYYNQIKEWFDYDHEINLLSCYNIKFIEWICNKLNINSEIVRASEFDFKESNSDLILEICKRFSAKTYISGISGKDYLELDKFRVSRIDVSFQNTERVYSLLEQLQVHRHASMVELVARLGFDQLHHILEDIR